MNADDPRAKWHPIDQNALCSLMQSTSSPNHVFPIATSALPAQIQAMPNITSYYVSNYTASVPLANNLTAGAEIAVVRIDGNTAKAYNYLVATSANGLVYFNGPHKDFSNHHFVSSSQVPIQALFNHVPVNYNSKP